MRARRGSAPGPRWGLHAGGCPPPVPPGPLLKKAGENLLENFSGFATDYAGPPLIGSGGLVWFAGRQGGKGWWMDRLDGGKSQRSRGGGGRAQRAQRRGGGLWPPPLRWFCGPSGPAKRRRPPWQAQGNHPPPFVTASPASILRFPGGTGKQRAGQGRAAMGLSASRRWRIAMCRRAHAEGGLNFFKLDAGVVVGEDLLEVSAFQGHCPGAVLAHTHPMAVAGGGNGNGILGKVQGEIGAAQI